MQYPDFTKWSAEELQKAELAAVDFLNDNVADIAATFEKRLMIIRRIIGLLKLEGVTFEQRLMYLTMIEELSNGLGQSAREFFEIGCVPSVANMLKGFAA
jgi:hypothetical protein